MLAGLPSREDVQQANEDQPGESIPYDVYVDSAWGGTFTNPNYFGADQFTVAEYSHPLVALLNADGNDLQITGMTTVQNLFQTSSNPNALIPGGQRSITSLQPGVT